ncbi:MAG: TrkA family potassium uptake protein [Thiogranum sp.]|nr:TrkA family potassium uptake protein [Thiogranum sp.]
MRTIFVGASPLSVMAARRLLKAGHDVVIIEEDEEKISSLSETLDCGFIHGDGSRPAVLEELSPGEKDMLFCLSNNDQDNIIASLVGQTMHFCRVITKIEDPDYQGICAKLGLEDVIIPDRDIGERLADMVEGHDVADLSVAVEGGIRFFYFIAREEHAGRIGDLDLPGDARIIVVTRGEDSVIVGDDDELRVDDRVLAVSHRRDLEKLKKRFGPDGTK